MNIFQTERLFVKALEEKDKEYFYELLSKPEIISSIPQIKYSEKEILEKFNKYLKVGNILESNQSVCGIFEKNDTELIGLALFLKNEEEDYELGYRFRVEYWGKGYGTEIAKGLINFYFKELKVDKVTADVSVENKGSIKILNKFMKPIKEYYGKKHMRIFRRYAVKKENWL